MYFDLKLRQLLGRNLFAYVTSWRHQMTLDVIYWSVCYILLIKTPSNIYWFCHQQTVSKQFCKFIGFCNFYKIRSKILKFPLEQAIFVFKTCLSLEDIFHLHIIKFEQFPILAQIHVLSAKVVQFLFGNSFITKSLI